MRQKRVIEKDFLNINTLLHDLMIKIFKGKNMDEMSNFDKRKRIFDFLVNNNDYDFELLNEILLKERRYPVEEIYSILEGINRTGRGKGVCNAFSYVYKLLLEKCDIPSMLIIGQLRKTDISNIVHAGIKPEIIERDASGRYLIDHMFILVQNEDGSYSFDDPTCAILGRDEGKNYFNYDMVGCAYRNQIQMQGLPTDYVEAVIGRNNPTEEDIAMKNKYGTGRNDGLLSLPDNITSYVEKKPEKQGIDKK